MKSFIQTNKKGLSDSLAMKGIGEKEKSRVTPRFLH